MIGLLDLPVEIRLMVYRSLFGTCKAVIDCGNQSDQPSLLSKQASIYNERSRSAQILRTCKTINVEAQPLLYAATQFVILTDAFAGRLPSNFHDGSQFAHLIQHLSWSLNCDFMRHLYAEDIHIAEGDLSNVRCLELRCQAQNWKGSLCGAWTDEQAIVRGRKDMLQYARLIRNVMRVSYDNEVFVIEEAAHRKRGRLVFRVQRTIPTPAENEVIIAD